MDQPVFDPNRYRAALVGQTHKLGDNIPDDVNQLVEINSAVVVTTDDEFDSCFFHPTEACHQWCVRVVEDGALLNFLSGLGHSVVDIGPLLDLCLEFLEGALLYLCIFYVL